MRCLPAVIWRIEFVNNSGQPVDNTENQPTVRQLL
jgi:hypothetical protein